MKNLVTMRGLYFEEYEPGATITTQARTITETDIVNFAAMSGDWNPLHTDAVTAGDSPYGGRIAHGLLVLSVASGLAERLGFMTGTVLGFMGLTWEFRAAVQIGDTIHVTASVEELKPMPRLGGGYVTFKLQVLNQANKVVQRGTWKVLIKSQEE